ncbi:MAG: MFS transporter [Actinobacteria bacterium]|nr:MFS transporter [Actinomycetota bacterium]MCL5445864.1 MFS transporter [Actinomycetota bacterium]
MDNWYARHPDLHPGNALAKLYGHVQASLGTLLDQNQPFGRLALVQVLSIAGDAMVTISLAGSLFFSISPDAAKGKVILYLLVTMAPFAVVAPVLGPLVDRSTSARRVMVTLSTGGRALLCLLMASDLRSLALFPEAFSILVLSRLYMLTKSTLVPILTSGKDASGKATSVAGHHEGLATRNAQLALLASIAGALGSAVGVGILKGIGASWVLRVDILVYFAGMVAGLRLPRRMGVRRPFSDQTGMDGGRSYRSVPGTGSVLPVTDLGGDWEPRDETRTYEPHIAGTGGHDAGICTHNFESSSAGKAGDRSRHPRAGYSSSAARQSLWMKAFVDPEVVLGLNLMSILRGLVGFFVFLIAFGLRREHAPTVWYGYVLVISGAGSLAGVLLVPRLRRVVSEQSLLTAAVWLVMLGAGASAFFGSVISQGIVAFTLGMGASGAQPAFDAIVQRLVPGVLQGRAFARFQTRLQLSWVVGSLISVMVAIPFVSGDIIVASVAGVAGLFYLTGRHSTGQRQPPAGSYGHDRQG